jgi:hypothetical protein
MTPGGDPPTPGGDRPTPRGRPAPRLEPPPAHLGRALRAALGVALVAALAGMAGDGPAHRAAAAIAIGLVVVVPLVRVAALTVGWARLGDRRFMLAGVALLAVIGAGAALAFLR